MKSVLKIFVFLFFSSVALCIGSVEPSNKVRLQFRWMHQFQFAGFYMAKELGYYRDAGLDVEIIEGGTDTDVMHKVIAGEAEYGVQTPSILVDRSKGHPVVVLAAIFQHSPVALVVSRESGITSLAMLSGKKIMLGAKNVEIRAMLKSEGILDKVEIIEFSGSYGDILSGKVSGASGYVTDMSYVETQTEETFSYIRPETYGIDFYGDCLFTSESEIKNNPDRALRFREASIRGWEYAMENPEKAVEVIKRKYGSEKTVAQLLYEHSQMNKLMHTDLVEIGHINPGRWKHILETFQKIGMIGGDYDIKGFLYTDHIEDDHNIARAILLFLATVLFAVIVIMYLKYRKEKIKKTLEEAKHKEELLKSEARFRGLIEFAADGIILGSNDGYITEANQAACELFGLERNQLTGKHFSEMPFTKESLEKCPPKYDLLNQGQIVISERIIRRPKDDTEITVEMKTKVMSDGTYQSIYRDITQRKVAEKEVNSLKSWFEYVLGATKTGFDIIDEDNNVIYVDPKWAEVLGDYRGKKCYQYFMGRSNPCPDCAMPVAFGKGVSAISEEFLEKENRLVEVHTIPLNETRNGKKLVSEFNIDITEKKNREKSLMLFMEAVENSQDGIGMASPEGIHIYQNKALTKLLGDFGTDPLNVYADKEAGRRMFLAISSGERWTGEVKMISSGGEIRNILLKSYPVFDLKGKITTLVGIHTDITELRKHEEILLNFNAELEKKAAERTAQLEEINRELEAFSYSVSHDLRAPVRHIIGFTDIFAKEFSATVSEKGKEIFAKITTAGQKMERLIDDLLMLSKTNRQEMTKSPVEMGTIVNIVLADYKECKENRNLVTVIPQLPVVKADRNLITMVWENLIDNACKYTKNKETSKIEIGFRTEGSEYIFHIRDNGVGFDPEFTHKLFGVFQRLHLDKDFSGTGIGLANVRRIISRHGGRTWAESEGEGKGASFYFTLPIN